MSDTSCGRPKPNDLHLLHPDGPRPRGRRPPDGAWSKQPAFGDAASGLVSTADDCSPSPHVVARGSPVLSETAVEEMTSDQLTAEQKERDGHGVLFGRSWAFCQSVITTDRAAAPSVGRGLGTSWLVDPRGTGGDRAHPTHVRES